jgi:GNAT superfamily N-acetyltransferase
MVTIRNETSFDIDAREHLLDRVWGVERFAKTAERLREGREPSAGLSFIAERDGDIVGTVRLWDVCAGPGRPAVLLGPLAVDKGHRACGIGGALVRRAIAAARRRKPRRRPFGRRRALLRAFRIFGGEDRSVVAAGSLRARPPLGLRAQGGNARRRARDDRRDRADDAGAKPRSADRGARSGFWSGFWPGS